MTLEYVLSAISTHPWIRRHRRAATWTLKRFAISLHVLKEVRILDHQIACDNWQWELDLNLSLAALQRHLLGLVPQSWNKNIFKIAPTKYVGKYVPGLFLSSTTA